MKGFQLFCTFLGGAALGATMGVLFAPEKGANLRARICKLLQEKGIHLNKEDMTQLVNQIAKEVKGGK